MTDSAALFAQEYAFAGHLRDPQGVAPPADCEPRRLAIYRRLFFRNLASLLQANFPVLHSLLEAAHWQAMVRDFMVRHQAHTPLFHEISKEFLTYLQHERVPHPQDPPFLLELAHYEWVELALFLADIPIDWSHIQPDGDLLTQRPALSPLCWNLSYTFPVHRIGPSFRPERAPAEPSHLVVYRDSAERVRFLEINRVTQRLLGLIQSCPDWTGQAMARQIAEELGHPDPGLVIDSARGLLEDLRQAGVLLGTRREPPSPTG